MKKKLVALMVIGLLGVIQGTMSLADKPARSGEEVFKSACATCHANHFPDAPQAHDLVAWQKKFAISANQAKQQNPQLSGQALDDKTMAVLVAKVRNGNKNMPAHGLCNDCTDQEYQNAIEFMMSANKPH